MAQTVVFGGQEQYDALVRELLGEINSLGIPGLPALTELFPVIGEYVNLSYPLPSGGEAKLLSDRGIYLSNQVECEFSDGTVPRFYGVTCSPGFLLVAEYGPNGTAPELLVYRKR